MESLNSLVVLKDEGTIILLETLKEIIQKGICKTEQEMVTDELIRRQKLGILDKT